MVMPLFRRGGQAQYIDLPAAGPTTDAMNELLPWALTQLPQGVDVTDLARMAAVSRRTLTRWFTQTTGLPPGEWLQAERLRLARRLLETTDLPVELVARRAGYESGAALRAQFTRQLHTSPRSYRSTFRVA
jgi:transcriptional regulator GlxA family with amidase domain